MRAGRDADGSGRPYRCELCLEGPVIIEDLYSLIALVRDIHVALAVDRQRMRSIKFSRLRAFVAPGFDVFAIFIELRDPRVAIPIRYKNVTGCIPSHVGWLIEEIARGARSRRARRPASTPSSSRTRRATRSATAFTSAAPPTNENRFRLATHRHCDARLRVELDDHTGAAINYPNVVLRVHLHALREQKAVKTLPELLKESPIGIELQKPCPSMRESARGAGGRV